MKSAEKGRPSSDRTPGRHLGTIVLSRTSTGYRGTWTGESAPHTVLLVTLEASSYPLGIHCRYANQRDPAGKRTFANMGFSESPPGLRLGPWPGWRGIPEMPRVFLEVNGKEFPMGFQWWGDEFATGKIRAVCAPGQDGLGEFVVHTVDPRLVPEKADLYATPRLHVTARPFAPSEGITSRHPRLLLSEEGLPGLRDHAGPGRRHSWELLLSCLDRWDMPLRTTAESKIPGGPEGLGGEDRLLVSAFIALLDPAKNNAVRAVDAYFRYLDLTREKDFEPLTIDTQSGEVLFLLCVGFDWLYDDLTEEQKGRARSWLWDVADICWSHLGYERDDYAQAHYLGCGMGLLAFSLLFFEEHPRAGEWAGHLHGVVRWICSSLPPDGFFAHGLNLWIYEFGFLLRWLELFRSGAGIDLWSSFPALAAASRFRAAATTPDGLEGLTMGDPQFRVGGDSWCHFLIAARTGSTEAQWLGTFLRDSPVEGVDFRNAPVRRHVYEYLWHDERIPPRGAGGTTAIFDDGGQVFLRTGTSLFTFRCGSPLGKHRYGMGMTGAYGHGDPCNGSFLLWDNGHFLVGGPGPVYRRESALHNIVTVDGQGQLGDTTVWLPDFIPPELIPSSPDVRLEPEGVAIDADLHRAYLPHLGVRTMKRSVQVWPGRRIAGMDTIDLTAAREVAWQCHSRGAFRSMEMQGRPAWTISFPDGTKARLMLYEPVSGTSTAGASDFVPAYPHDGTGDSFVRLSVRGVHVRFLWVLVLADEPLPTFEPGEASHLRFGDGTRLLIGEHTLARV